MQSRIARTILDQLTRAPAGQGMGRLVAMTGARDFLAGTYGVGFAVSSAAHGIKRVSIKLEADDTYELLFLGKAPKTDRYATPGSLAPIHRVRGLMASDLARVFTEKTGLYTSL